ncbi:MAG: NUDIX domain-containing protein [Dongiaceae bacterium]
MTQSKAQLINKESLWEGHLKLYRYQLRVPLLQGGWSEVMSREVCVRGDSVCILPIDANRKALVMVEQYRLPAELSGHDPWQMEIPAGLVENGEKLDQVAKRELKEETGLEITKLRHAITFMPSPGAIDETTHVFTALADSAKAGGIHGKSDEGENIRVHAVPIKNLAANLYTPKWRNGLMLAAVQWLLLNQEKILTELQA